MSSSDQPIGIFDSGIGGLTVAHKLVEKLPNESLIYFGDTAHLPYGDKSPQAIQTYSEVITDFLLERNCKLIVVACNTASSFAYQHLKDKFQDRVPIINVIDPVVEYLAAQEELKPVGIIGTKGTIKSNAYVEKLHKLKPELDVRALATPLFAPMIEEGFVANQISQTVITQYLKHESMEGIGSLILACTHYPLLKDEISAYFDGKVDVIDSASVVASYVHDRLADLDLLSEQVQEHHFFVSDYTEQFEKIAKRFFTEQVLLEYFPLWQNEAIHK